MSRAAMIMITGQTDADPSMHGVKARWVNWVAQTGANVIIAPPVRSNSYDLAVKQLLDHVDGVLVPGGADVDPALYGATQLDPSRELRPERDAFESAIIRRCIERDIPLLCVCRGFQLLNVVCGGSLSQRLDDEPGIMEHWQDEPYHLPSHEITLTARTRLALTLGTKPLQVNSMHDQGILKQQVAPKLRIAATASDGLVEALEYPSKRFCVGVQWHPEFMPQEQASSALIHTFVSFACPPER